MFKLLIILFLCIISIFTFIFQSHTYAYKEPSLNEIIEKLSQATKDVKNIILDQLLPPVQIHLSTCLLAQDKKRTFNTLRGHTSLVRSISFSSEGTKIA